MKYQDSFVGTKAEFADFVKKIIPDLFGGRLLVENKGVSIPGELPLDYKVKFDEDETGGSFTLKVSWDLAVEEEEDNEVQIDID
ncbi:MAG TPA: transcription initiation factor IIE [Clostridia bacterium]